MSTTDHGRVRWLLPALVLIAGCTPDHRAGSSDWPESCPDPDHPGVQYMHEHWEDRDVCALIDFGCDSAEHHIGRVVEGDCGCGCISTAACRDAPSCTVP